MCAPLIPVKGERMEVLNERTSLPLSALLQKLDIRGAHLYDSLPTAAGFSADGIVYGVSPIEDDEGDLFIRTKPSPDSTIKSGIVIFSRCTLRTEEYLQCEKGTFGCVIIDDPVTGRQIAIHGVRLNQ